METYNNKDVKISIQKLFDSLLQSPSNCCIRKVPEYMSKQSECYEPSVVSIGPLYYNKGALKSFHELKVRHLQCFLRCSNLDYDMGKYIDILRTQENQIRSYYDETINVSSNNFIEMILIDATFIIIFFMLASDEFLIGKHPMYRKPELICMVQQDLFLVGNQLPFFVLKNLYDKSFGASYPYITFEDLTCSYISSSFLLGSGIEDTIICKRKIRKAFNITHLVEFLRICYLPTNQDLLFRPKCNEFLKKGVTQLKAAGVKFKASKNMNLLDIKFSKGVLHVPTLVIQDTTEKVLRSIIFFEQCHYSNESYIIQYLFFMDALIDTTEDVQILVKKGIIKHYLGSDKKVATLFNHLIEGVEKKNSASYYKQISKDLNKYADSKWHRWKAVLRKNYFNHPWSIMSMTYLGVLLILTALQVYTGFVKG